MTRQDNDEVDLPETRSIASLEDFASTVLTGRALGPRGMGDGSVWAGMIPYGRI